MAGSEGRDPLVDLETLRTEVKLYDEDLAGYDWLVVANKMDLEGAAGNLERFRQRFPRVEVVAVSAEHGQGLDDLRRILCERVGKGPEELARRERV